MFKRVLLCYDGSDHGLRALKRGADLAMLVGAQVFVLSIVKTDVLSPAVMAAVAGCTCLVDEHDHDAVLDSSVARLRALGVRAQGYLAHGDTLKQIVAYSKKLAIDLIVIGHYPGKSGGRWWSGSDRASLADQVTCCVFIAVNAAPEGQGNRS